MTHTIKIDCDAINQGRSCVETKTLELILLCLTFFNSQKHEEKGSKQRATIRTWQYRRIVTFRKGVGGCKSVKFSEKPMNNLSKVKAAGRKCSPGGPRVNKTPGGGIDTSSGASSIRKLG